MFQFSGFALLATTLQVVRFPHSEISGSIHICWSPELIAAYHVLLRLWEPRHSPCALSYFLLLTAFCSVRMLFREVSSSRYQVARPKSLCLMLTTQYFPYCCLLFHLLFSNMSKNFLQFVNYSICPFVCNWQIGKWTNRQIEPWRITDSNRWPPACKAGALASWANSPKSVVPSRLELLTPTLSV